MHDAAAAYDPAPAHHRAGAEVDRHHRMRGVEQPAHLVVAPVGQRAHGATALVARAPRPAGGARRRLVAGAAQRRGGPRADRPDPVDGQAELRGGLLLGDALEVPHGDDEPFLRGEPVERPAVRAVPPGAVGEAADQLAAGLLVRVLGAHPEPVGVDAGEDGDEQVLRVVRVAGEQSGGMQQSSARARGERLEFGVPSGFRG